MPSAGQQNSRDSHHIAFKWADETARTTLREIEWSASRTGLINPVAIFDPVELEGTTVSRASVHNISIVKELQLGIGDTITVYKANMIIPQIAENLTKSGSLEIRRMPYLPRQNRDTPGKRYGNSHLPQIPTAMPKSSNTHAVRQP